MQLESIKNSEFSDDYWKLVQDKYISNPAFQYYFNDLKKGAAYCIHSSKIKFENLSVFRGGSLKAHTTLILHEDLDKETAYFGFFECVNDTEIFELLWKNLLRQAKDKGIKKLLGPISGSIWHAYRVISVPGNEDHFPSEPVTDPRYFSFLNDKNPEKIVEYHSAYRQRFNRIIKHTRKSYKSLKNKEIEIRKLSAFDEESALSVYNLSLRVFEGNWGYVPLSPEEFLQLYSSDKIEEYIASVYVALSGNKIIGFSSNMQYKDSLIMKTIAVDPEYQQTGVASGLVHVVHSKAKSAGIRRIIYALVRKTNKIKHFPTDDVKILREYAGFEFWI